MKVDRIFLSVIAWGISAVILWVGFWSIIFKDISDGNEWDGYDEYTTLVLLVGAIVGLILGARSARR